MKGLFFTMLFSSGFLMAQSGKSVTTPNGQFALFDEGRGTPVLLLHGFPDSKALWQHQIPKLVAAGYRVIAPDLRGYGDSPRPKEKEQYAMPLLMGDVIGILDALELEQVHLVGHDWGAALSWTLAQYFGHRFLSLTALSVGSLGNSGWDSLEQRQKSWYFYLFLQEGLAEKTLADNDWEFARRFMASHPMSETLIEGFRKEGRLTTGLNWYRANMQDLITRPGVDYSVVNNETPPAVTKMELPVLGIWSDGDLFLTETQMQRSSEHAADFTYKRLEGAGHWMMLDQPDAFTAILLEFLKNQP